MKKITFILLTTVLALTSYSQDLVSKRESTLEYDGYEVYGKAILREFSDGSLTLTLDDDFKTQWGPDVQIFLSSEDGEVSSDAILITNLTADNPSVGGGGFFLGEYVYDLGTETGINDYEYIVFRCVRFSQSWAKGTFAERVITNIEENTDTKMEVFPNPTSSLLQINLMDKSVNYVQIFDALGNMVYEQDIESYLPILLNVSFLESGVYYVRLENDEEYFDTVFVKE